MSDIPSDIPRDLPTTLNPSLFSNPSTCYTLHRPAPGLISITLRDRAALNLSDLVTNAYDSLVLGKPASFPLGDTGTPTYPRFLRHCSGTLYRLLRTPTAPSLPIDIVSAELALSRSMDDEDADDEAERLRIEYEYGSDLSDPSDPTVPDLYDLRDTNDQ